MPHSQAHRRLDTMIIYTLVSGWLYSHMAVPSSVLRVISTFWSKGPPLVWRMVTVTKEAFSLTLYWPAEYPNVAAGKDHRRRWVTPQHCCSTIKLLTIIIQNVDCGYIRHQGQVRYDRRENGSKVFRWHFKGIVIHNTNLDHFGVHRWVKDKWQSSNAKVWSSY